MLSQCLATRPIFFPMRITPVDQDIPCIQPTCKIGNRLPSDFSSRQHHPNATWRRTKRNDLVQIACRRCTFLSKRCPGSLIAIIDHTGMSGPQEPTHHVATHTTQAEHGYRSLHILSSSNELTAFARILAQTCQLTDSTQIK